MSKTIRVEEEVWERLDKLRDWKESFSQVIVRLLKVHEVVNSIKDTLGPSHYLGGSRRPGGEE